jgi:hypothetical protein
MGLKSPAIHSVASGPQRRFRLCRDTKAGSILRQYASAPKVAEDTVPSGAQAALQASKCLSTQAMCAAQRETFAPSPVLLFQGVVHVLLDVTQILLDLAEVLLNIAFHFQ